MTFTIKLDKITKRFGEFTALKDVTATLGEGDRISILGHNGAGKSTLLNIVATLTRPTSGKVTFFEDNQELTKDIQVRKRLSFLSHEPMLYPDLTAEENLRFTARLYGRELDDQALAELLEKVGMTRARKRLFRTCSRGMQQRLSLARALLPDPKLLLLDEPFSGLDNEGVGRMTGLLAKHSWVMVTHDLKLGYEMADYFWIFRRGKLVYQLAKKDVDFEKYMTLSRVPRGEALAV